MPKISNARNGRLPFDLGAFDLDGTVLRRDLAITEATVVALNALREQGVRLVVATGRRFEGAREHAERLGFGECFGHDRHPASTNDLSER